MSRKNKFDLADLVHKEYVKEGEFLFFVSDPSKKCQIIKMPNGDFKVTGFDGKPTTVHAFAQACLGMDPPEHASRWLRTDKGKTMYEIWHMDDDAEAA